MINRLRDRIHEIAKDKGWWPDADPEDRIPEAIALIHSEVSEALEEYRSGHPDWYGHTGPEGKPLGFRTELADIIIRVLDLCGALEIDIGSAIDEKVQYNETRPYRHGGKRA